MAKLETELFCWTPITKDVTTQCFHQNYMICLSMVITVVGNNLISGEILDIIVPMHSDFFC